MDLGYCAYDQKLGFSFNSSRCSISDSIIYQAKNCLKMKWLIVLPLIVAAAVHAADTDDTNAVSEEFINTINSMATTWKVND